MLVELAEKAESLICIPQDGKMLPVLMKSIEVIENNNKKRGGKDERRKFDEKPRELRS